MTHPDYFQCFATVPRLYHCPPGSTVSLARWDSKAEKWMSERPRTIATIEGRHAVFDDGLIVSLCHPVSSEWMKFGDGDGWRPLIHTNCGQAFGQVAETTANPLPYEHFASLITEST